MRPRLFLYVCLVLFSGWTTCGYAILLKATEVPTAQDSNTVTIGNTDKPAASSPEPPSSASQKPEQHNILTQPSADFVCPRAAAKASAIECFLDAVEHLYTVCRQVKAIELLEFGFDQAEKGANGLKSEFCRRKQKASLPHYFEAALREAQAMSSCEAARLLNDLYIVWATTIAGLRQSPNETEAEYQQRITVPYPAFAAYRQHVRDALVGAGQGPVQSCPSLATFKP
ncbi:MAG: hypothetical protein LBP90_05590 [Burkholderiales bacterium]|nr:hypothetical protein [Burkholderiales bacterium]